MPYPVGISISYHIEQLAFNSDTKSQRMSPLGEERVVVCLNGIPMIIIGWAASDPPGKGSNALDEDLGCGSSGKSCAADSQIGSGCIWIDRLQTLIVVYGFVVAADTNRVRKAR